MANDQEFDIDHSYVLDVAWDMDLNVQGFYIGAFDKREALLQVSRILALPYSPPAATEISKVASISSSSKNPTRVSQSD